MLVRRRCPLVVRLLLRLAAVPLPPPLQLRLAKPSSLLLLHWCVPFTTLHMRLDTHY